MPELCVPLCLGGWREGARRARRKTRKWAGLGGYFRFYNRERPHQGLDYRTPWEVLTGTPTTSREKTGHGHGASSPFRFKMEEENTVKTLV